jgi:large subunit ribosomal protein L23
MNLYDIVRRPIISEKAQLMGEDLGQYVFEVKSDANKIQIKEAVEVLFDVEVKKVRVIVMPAKRGRRGKNWYVRSQQWKKAIVTLAADDKIELFNL